MITKAENLEDMKYTNHAILCSEMLNNWVLAKPGSKNLLAFQDSFIQMCFHQSQMQNKLANAKLAASMYRESRNKLAVKCEDLQSELNKLDKHFKPTEYEAKQPLVK
tara:strand:+ start:241 stop:561 length:321 start_codon:yes stop_codon:yes gene_type:complete